MDLDSAQARAGRRRGWRLLCNQLRRIVAGKTNTQARAATTASVWGEGRQGKGGRRGAGARCRCRCRSGAGLQVHSTLRPGNAPATCFSTGQLGALKRRRAGTSLYLSSCNCQFSWPRWQVRERPCLATWLLGSVTMDGRARNSQASKVHCCWRHACRASRPGRACRGGRWKETGVSE